MISSDELTLILDCFPTCKLVQLRLVNHDFKKIVDRLLIKRNGFNCKNFLPTNSDPLKYRLKYGCTHIILYRMIFSNETIDDYFAIACGFSSINPIICINMLNFLYINRSNFKGTINKKTKLDTLQKILNMENYNIDMVIDIMNFEENVAFNEIVFLMLKNGSFDILLEHEKRNNPCKFVIIMNSMMTYCPKIIRIMMGYYLYMMDCTFTLSQFIIRSLRLFIDNLS